MKITTIIEIKFVYKLLNTSIIRVTISYANMNLNFNFYKSNNNNLN